MPQIHMRLRRWWTRTGKYVAVLASASGLVATIIGVWYPYHLRKQDGRIQIHRLLAEATDEISGKAGSTRVATSTYRTPEYERQLEIAHRKLHEAWVLDPEHGPTHEALAIYWHQKGNLERASRAWKEAMRLNPRSPTAHSGLGGTLILLGRLDEAIAEYDTSVRVAPYFRGNYVTRGAALTTRFFYTGDPNDADRAERDFRFALTMDPNNADAYRNLAQLAMYRGDTTALVQFARAAIDRDPNDAAAHRHMATGLIQSGRFDEAETSARHAVSLVPNSGQGFFVLATILVCRGQSRLATAAVVEGLRLEQPTSTVTAS